MPSKITHREPKSILFMRLLIVAGFVAIAVLFRWMILASLQSPWWISVLLLGSACFFIFQVAVNWVMYWYATRKVAPASAGSVSIDVYLTVYNESHDLVERALRAAVAMHGKHATWLLDDSRSPALEDLAKKLGVFYLSRSTPTNRKAGNVNWALERTSGDVVAVFDIDHVPEPTFLERSVGYFDDPSVGFVQIMLTFSNESVSWIARAAAESSLDFYNATSLGMDAIGGSTMMGSNSIIRRSALLSIGGYRPGLAEDLATSIALHAAGWASRYVAEPLAPGLAPPDLFAWFTQQMKWSRGVYEVLIADYPRLFLKLTPAQRLCYANRMTKYWVGPFVAGHLTVTILLLWLEPKFATDVFNQYVLHLMPLVAVDFTIRSMAKRLWCEKEDRAKSIRRAVMLIYSSFPVYTVTWIMAIFRVPLSFRPTPKKASGQFSTAWRVPIVIGMLAFDSALVYAIGEGQFSIHPFFIVFASLETLPIIVMFYHSLRIGTNFLHRNRQITVDPRIHEPTGKDIDVPKVR